MRLMLIAVLFLGCASGGPAPSTLERGTFTAPPPAPVRPGVGAPTYDPRAPTAPMPPRSPHKRLLPPTAGPGIWAGDEPKAAKRDKADKDPAIVLGFTLPAPLTPSNDVTRTCRFFVNEGLDTTKARAKLADVHPDVVRCMVARWFEHCVRAREWKEQEAIRRAEADSSPLADQLSETHKVAVAFVDTACNKVVFADNIRSLFLGVSNHVAKRVSDG